MLLTTVMGAHTVTCTNPAHQVAVHSLWIALGLGANMAHVRLQVPATRGAGTTR